VNLAEESEITEKVLKGIITSLFVWILFFYVSTHVPKWGNLCVFIALRSAPKG